MTEIAHWKPVPNTVKITVNVKEINQNNNNVDQ